MSGIRARLECRHDKATERTRPAVVHLHLDHCAPLYVEPWVAGHTGPSHRQVVASRSLSAKPGSNFVPRSTILRSPAQTSPYASRPASAFDGKSSARRTLSYDRKSFAPEWKRFNHRNILASRFARLSLDLMSGKPIDGVSTSMAAMAAASASPGSVRTARYLQTNHGQVSSSATYPPSIPKPMDPSNHSSTNGRNSSGSRSRPNSPARDLAMAASLAPPWSGLHISIGVAR